MTDRKLWVDDVAVANYVAGPELDIRLGPRPYLHPVRTLGGVTVTDELCFDHPWHLGASVTVANVNGWNLWGGKTCLPDRGYTWLEDHGRITHVDWEPTLPDPGSGLSSDAGVGSDSAAGSRSGDGSGGGGGSGSGFGERLRWEDVDGGLLVHESRRVAVRSAPLGWRLSFDYELTAPAGSEVTLGSPRTSGFPGAAGYGGFFWRAAPGPARLFSASGSDQVKGSAEPWVALAVEDAYTLVFEGLSGDDRWFARADEYSGVCAALAYDRPLTIAGGSTLSRRIRVLVADGAPTHTQISEAMAQG